MTTSVFTQGANALVTYTIISGADDSFHIDPESGDLIATKRLDRERRSKYSLLVRADDGLQSSDMRINITVSDVNDHIPKFSKPVYSFDIPEDATPGKQGMPPKLTEFFFFFLSVPRNLRGKEEQCLTWPGDRICCRCLLGGKEKWRELHHAESLLDRKTITGDEKFLFSEK